MRKAAVWLILAALGFSSAAFGQSFNFRMTTSVYNWERFDTDSTTSKHLRVYQLGSLNVSRLFGQKNLSFHTYLGYSSDLGQKAGNDPQNLLYSAYLDWRNLPGRGQLRFGRQRIFAGVGFGTLDGVLAKFTLMRRVRILGYAGLLAPALNEARLEKWDDSHMIGGQLQITPVRQLNMSLSYVRRNRLPLRYKLPGRFTEERLTFQSLQNELLGFDVAYSGFGNAALFGRLDYDLGLRRIRRLDFRGSYHVGVRWQFGVSLIHRTPYQNLNSIFSVFTQYGYDEYALNFRYKFNDSFSFVGHGGTRVYNGDNGLFFGGGLYWKNQYVGYYHRSGYEGLGDNFIVQTNVLLKRNVTFLLGANVFSYVMDPNFTSERELAVAGNLGVIYRPTSWVNINLQLQSLHNERYRSDVRFFLRATYWYFKR